MNKIEIKSLATGEVIFSHEAENNTIRATVEKAVRKGVSLRRATLYGVNLSGADLSGADLYGATLYGVIGDGIIIRSAQFEKYRVVICDDWLQIGCKGYRVHEWIEFSDARIRKMDPGALKWWKANKAAVFAFAGWGDELSIAK